MSPSGVTDRWHGWIELRDGRTVDGALAVRARTGPEAPLQQRLLDQLNHDGRIRAVAEVVVFGGRRCDVVTRNMAIEVKVWTDREQALEQAKHYARRLQVDPVVALFGDATLAQVNDVCREMIGVEVIWYRHGRWFAAQN